MMPGDHVSGGKRGVVELFQVTAAAARLYRGAPFQFLVREKSEAAGVLPGEGGEAG